MGRRSSKAFSMSGAGRAERRAVAGAAEGIARFQRVMPAAVRAVRQKISA